MQSSFHAEIVEITSENYSKVFSELPPQCINVQQVFRRNFSFYRSKSRFTTKPTIIPRRLALFSKAFHWLFPTCYRGWVQSSRPCCRLWKLIELSRAFRKKEVSTCGKDDFSDFRWRKLERSQKPFKKTFPHTFCLPLSCAETLLEMAIKDCPNEVDLLKRI